MWLLLRLVDWKLMLKYRLAVLLTVILLFYFVQVLHCLISVFHKVIHILRSLICSFN